LWQVESEEDQFVCIGSITHRVSLLAERKGHAHAGKIHKWRDQEHTYGTEENVHVRLRCVCDL